MHLSCVLRDTKVSNSCDVKSFIDQRDQGLANVFCKGRDSKCFRLCRSYSLS